MFAFFFIYFNSEISLFCLYEKKTYFYNAWWLFKYCNKHDAVRKKMFNSKKLRLLKAFIVMSFKIAELCGMLSNI